MKILLVEDDHQVGESVKFALAKQGHSVNWVMDGEAAIVTIDMEEYSLVLLDLGIPKKSGQEVLLHIRSRFKELPVIIITARDSTSDKVRGLDAGADDYLVKPFSLEELHARIRAILRRWGGHSANILKTAHFSLNMESKMVSFDGEKISFTAKEYSVLYELINSAGKILSRDQLEEKIYGWNEEVSSNSVEFLIHSIRRKTSKLAIKNIRGLGWMIPKE